MTSTVVTVTVTTTATSRPLHLRPASLRPPPTSAPPVARPGGGRHRRAVLRCASVSEVAPAVSAAYGALLVGGGAFAYARSGSKGSILGGVSGSALMGLTYYLMQFSETKALGDAVGFGSAFLFASVFGIRLYNTRKLVPSGLLLALSLGALGVFYAAYLQDKV
ncbi:protein FATTY ACID EXPORT 4, chloroplastic [Hordeum vulgare subsp. vulgare]|uniref:Predicted protein n=2 Tax=Triticeae TaxID=147389 RepID=F2EH02_HORVV|nr:protein FATTY ACID EXPORT 4, chloroplastic [Hordeum vulgare subsp. vulgare]BAK06624.1 predicted protein [Hordeum vulgare subsp. vulgare]